MRLEEFANQAVTRPVPFVPFGRSWDGVDCWGLIWLAYREVMDQTLPSYSHLYARTEDWATTDAIVRQALPSWEMIGAPRAGAVALFRIGGHYAHVGLALGAGRMLHILRGIDVCCEPLGGAVWQQRLIGCYVPAGR